MPALLRAAATWLAAPRSSAIESSSHKSWSDRSLCIYSHSSLLCQAAGGPVAPLMLHDEQRIDTSRENLGRLLCGSKELTALAAVQRRLEGG